MDVRSCPEKRARHAGMSDTAGVGRLKPETLISPRPRGMTVRVRRYAN